MPNGLLLCREKIIFHVSGRLKSSDLRLIHGFDIGYRPDIKRITRFVGYMRFEQVDPGEITRLVILRKPLDELFGQVLGREFPVLRPGFRFGLQQSSRHPSRSFSLIFQPDIAETSFEAPSESQDTVGEPGGSIPRFQQVLRQRVRAFFERSCVGPHTQFYGVPGSHDGGMGGQGKRELAESIDIHPGTLRQPVHVGRVNRYMTGSAPSIGATCVHGDKNHGFWVIGRRVRSTACQGHYQDDHRNGMLQIHTVPIVPGMISANKNGVRVCERIVVK